MVCENCLINARILVIVHQILIYLAFILNPNWRDFIAVSFYTYVFICIMFDIEINSELVYVFWAPLPWQIRGGADIVAFVANVLLFILIFRYRRPFHLEDPFQLFLLMAVVSLTLVVTVAAGNVGLVLRQKTIILPFLFLFLFGKSDKVDTAVQA